MTQSSRPKATCKTLIEKKNTCKSAKFMRYCMLLFVTICVVIVVVNVVVGKNKNFKSRTFAGFFFDSVFLMSEKLKKNSISDS